MPARIRRSKTKLDLSDFQAHQLRAKLHFGKVKKFPRRYPPKAIEQKYYQELKRILESLKSITAHVIIPRIPHLVLRAQSGRPNVKRDDDLDPDDINSIVDSAEVQIDTIWTVDEIRRMATEVASSLLAFNKRDAERVLAAAFGSGFQFGSEPYLNQATQLFIANNFNLIESIPSQYFDKVSSMLYADLSSGTGADQIVEDLQDIYDVTDSRASLIAVDQIGKFNGEVDRARFTDIGANYYRWRTQEDDRVRPEHEDLDGELRSWDDSPIPGEEIRCRCYAEWVTDEEVADELGDDAETDTSDESSA